MKKTFKHYKNWAVRYFSVLLVAGGWLAACAPAEQTTVDYTVYVDPFIGTGGHGHTFPGLVVPRGMVQPGPDTRLYDWDSCSGYYYNDSTINGFSHNRLSGTGCCDYGDVLLMPTVGEQRYEPTGSASQQMAYCSAFSHEKEVAVPGYYSVFLDRYQVQAELTSTTRAAIHRYTFPESTEAGFILDLDYSLQRQINRDMVIEILNDSTIQGHKRTIYWAFDQPIYFYMQFSKPFTTHTLVTDSAALDKGGELLPQMKALLRFDRTQADEQVLVKVGLSSVDAAGAKANVETEIPDWNFDKVRQAAHEAWNKELAAIDVKTTLDDHRTIFYTGMYHAMIAPTVFTDVDGRYFGMDHQVHQVEPGEEYYTIFSLWDTFRAVHPLLSIIRPELNEAFIRSLIKKSEEGGIFPKWDMASNYTGTMIGYHAVSLIADAYTKGYRNFDVQKAYKASLRAAEYDTTGIKCPDWMIPYVMPKARYYKNTIGYVPCDKDNEAVAKALEYAYDDWCIAVLAKELGDSANYQKYQNFAKGYQTYYDKQTGFMRGLDSQRKWREPFNPNASNHRNDDYCEGNAWQWSWFVPHDPEGLMELVGGREEFVRKLDELFTTDAKLEGEEVSADISGLIGQYAHGNEPSHHITHFYNYAGYPSKTQELVDKVLQTLYFNDPNGLSGNEDCGQMSSWYILNAMGFYQVCPGNPVYSIGRPLFDEVTIHLPNGKDFRIQAKNNSLKNKYVKSALLNGKALEKPFFTHQELVQGGTLVFEMTDQPAEWNSIK